MFIELDRASTTNVKNPHLKSSLAIRYVMHQGEI